MALTIDHVWTDANSLIYRVTAASMVATSSVDLNFAGTTAGSSSARNPAYDVAQTAYGRAGGAALRKVCRAYLDGLGAITASGMTGNQLLALVLGDGAAADLGVATPRARLRLQRRSGTVRMVATPKNLGASVSSILLLETTNIADGVYYAHIELAHSLDR